MEKSKIYLGSYPYAYARISAMKSLLLRRSDYDKLLKMKHSEIARFLQETQYKKEIDEAAVSIEGIDKLEIALKRNLTRDMLKVKRISDGNLRVLIDFYLKRKDIANIKTIFRAKFTGFDPKQTEELLLPIGELDFQYLRNLIQKAGVEDIAKAIPFVNLASGVKYFKDNNSLFEIENLLDKYYYEELIKFADRIASQGKLFKDFLMYEIDILNIKTILRLKKEGLKPDFIEKYLFYSGKNLEKKKLQAMVAMSDIKDIIKLIKRSGYKKALEKTKDEESIIDLEIALNHYLLDKAMILFHQNPLSVDLLLGYMFAKEIEVRNLKIIIKGKKLGLEEDFITKELVVGK